MLPQLRPHNHRHRNGSTFCYTIESATHLTVRRLHKSNHKGNPKSIDWPSIHWNESDIELDNDQRERVVEAIEQFGTPALRTLAIAFEELTEDELDRPQEQHEQDLVFLALHGIIDPLRPAAIEAVRQCRDAGIRTVMITGDHAATAATIATELGIRHLERDLIVARSNADTSHDGRHRDFVRNPQIA